MGQGVEQRVVQGVEQRVVQGVEQGMGQRWGRRWTKGWGRAQSYYNYRSHWAQYADNTQPYCKLVVMLYRPAGEVTKATMDSRIFHMCNARWIVY